MGYCVPFGWSGLFRCLGAQRPVARPAPGGGPAFFGRKPEERTPGRKRFFLPGPTFSGWGDPAGVLSFFLPGLRPMCPTPVTARPPAGRAGKGGGCSRKGTHPRPKPSPWGEGAPVRTLGRMRGRSTHPTEREKEGGGATGPSFYKERLGTESPPHQSPSVTASPQGEAFAGGTPPQRNAFSPKPCSRKMRIQIRARTWAPK